MRAPSPAGETEADSGPASLPGAAGVGLHPEGRLRPNGQAEKGQGRGPQEKGPALGSLWIRILLFIFVISEIRLRLNIAIGQVAVMA